MTASLELAFAAPSKLSAAEQDLLASRLLAEMAAEDDFDRALAGCGDQLARLAAEALAGCGEKSQITDDLVDARYSPA